MEAESKTKIYCFVNSGAGTDWQSVLALAEDGHVLAQHVSSHELWARHDIGFTSDWKHEQYREHYPAGYELEWVDDVKGHPGVAAAYALNQQLPAANEQGDAAVSA